MAEEIGDDALRAHALNNIGVARISTGRLGGMDDLEESVGSPWRANSPGKRARLRQPGSISWISVRSGVGRDDEGRL